MGRVLNSPPFRVSPGGEGLPGGDGEGGVLDGAALFAFAGWVGDHQFQRVVAGGGLGA